MKVTLGLNNEGRRFFIVDNEDGLGDIIYVSLGNCAQISRYSEATESELRFAFGPDSPQIMGDLGKEIYNTWVATDWHTNMNKVFYNKVNEFALVTPAKELYSIIQNCKANHNNLPEEHQVAGYRIVNADDCYCSALIALTRPQFGQNAERKIFNALAESEYEFVKQVEAYRKALAIISKELDESLEDLITIHK